MPSNAIMETDPPRWRWEIERLEEQGRDVRRCSPHHLKIGPINYYPGTGKIYVDPHTKHLEKGFDALLKLLADIDQRNTMTSISRDY